MRFTELKLNWLLSHSTVKTWLLLVFCYDIVINQVVPMKYTVICQTILSPTDTNSATVGGVIGGVLLIVIVVIVIVVLWRTYKRVSYILQHLALYVVQHI